MAHGRAGDRAREWLSGRLTGRQPPQQSLQRTWCCKLPEQSGVGSTGCLETAGPCSFPERSYIPSCQIQSFLSLPLLAVSRISGNSPPAAFRIPECRGLYNGKLPHLNGRPLDCELRSAACEGAPGTSSGSPVWGLDLGQEPGKTEVHFPSENRPSESRKIPEAA